jgi:hypothetical protein
MIGAGRIRVRGPAKLFDDFFMDLLGLHAARSELGGIEIIFE